MTYLIPIAIFVAAIGYAVYRRRSRALSAGPVTPSPRPPRRES